MGLDENAFAIYKVVLTDSPGFSADESKSFNALFVQHSDFRWNDDQKSKLRTELYKVLRPKVGTGRMIEVTNRLLNIQRV